MKARIPVSKKMRKSLEQEAKVVMQEEMIRQREDFTRKLFKLMCYSLNENFGFGNGRCSNLIGDIAELIKRADTDEVFWEHIDKVVIDYLRLPFERDYTN